MPIRLKISLSINGKHYSLILDELNMKPDASWILFLIFLPKPKRRVHPIAGRWNWRFPAPTSACDLGLTLPLEFCCAGHVPCSAGRRARAERVCFLGRQQVPDRGQVCHATLCRCRSHKPPTASGHHAAAGDVWPRNDRRWLGDLLRR